MLNNIRIDRKFWINAIFFLLGGCLVVYLYTKYRVAPDISLSDLSMKTTEGAPVNTSQFKGKVVLLNCWQTWCGPCVGELSSIENARRGFDSTKVVFITVSDEAPEKIAAFRERHDYHFQYFISGKKFSDLGINTYPTTYIIGKDGKVVLTKIGSADWNSPEMTDRLKELSR